MAIWRLLFLIKMAIHCARVCIKNYLICFWFYFIFNHLPSYLALEILKLLHLYFWCKNLPQIRQNELPKRLLYLHHVGLCCNTDKRNRASVKVHNTSWDSSAGDFSHLYLLLSLKQIQMASWCQYAVYKLLASSLFHNILLYTQLSFYWHADNARVTFRTFLVIFPKEFGMMRRTGLVEWLEVLRRFW